MLKGFDEQWTLYERSYVFELMVIEKDARRFVTQAVQHEQQLTRVENGKAKGDMDGLRDQIIQRLCEINPVTNSQGKGREDFKLEVLLKAEELSIKPNSTGATKKVADQVKNTFNLFRTLLRKYSENIEVVDPMLRNNQEL